MEWGGIGGVRAKREEKLLQVGVVTHSQHKKQINLLVLRTSGVIWRKEISHWLHVIRWTPELPFGVLQMADIFVHMEYSIWPYNFTIWSTPDVKIIEPYGVLYCSVLSTPWGSFFLPHGALSDLLQKSAHHNITSPHGVLHKYIFLRHMECYTAAFEALHRAHFFATWSS